MKSKIYHVYICNTYVFNLMIRCAEAQTLKGHNQSYIYNNKGQIQSFSGRILPRATAPSTAIIIRSENHQMFKENSACKNKLWKFYSCVQNVRAPISTLKGITGFPLIRAAALISN